jgi:hypothetical protein
MWHRKLALAAASLALALFVVAPALAKKGGKGKSHKGTVVSVEGNKLTMTGKKGKNHSHEIGDDVTITLNGKTAKLSDLKPGTKIKVTMEGKKVTKIEAKTKKKKGGG